MKIVIPSYRRPDNCLTAKLLRRAVIAVHKNEIEEYRKHNQNEILEMPDELAEKGMAVIRNWILDNAGDEEILMIDDDIKYFLYFERSERKKMDEEMIYELAENGFRMARECGTKLWGINVAPDKIFYKECSPFALTSPVCGTFFGAIRDPEIRFDERLGLKEDYDYSIQILKKYRKIWRFNKYFYQAEHINSTGGCSGYRSFDREKEQAELLQKKWGKKIVRINRKGQHGHISINPIVKVPIKGI